MAAVTDPLQELAQRVRVAHWSGIWPPDLADAVLGLIDEVESARSRRQQRDSWLRRAGRYWSGSAWIRAGFVHRELIAQADQRHREHFDPETFRGACSGVLLIDPRIPSRKQIARILEVDTAD